MPAQLSPRTPTRNQWAAIAEQEAQLGLPDSTQLGRNSSAKAGDRSSTCSTSSGPASSGGGKRNSGTDSTNDGVGGGGDGQAAAAQSAHSSLTFGGQRRYSGGTIGIASMLGSLSVVPTGRSISDGSMDRRVSSVLGASETPPEFVALGGNGAAWRRQSAMGQPRGTGGGGGLGYPRWGGGVARASGLRAAGWGEEIVDEEGGIEGGAGAGAGAGAGGGVGWSIDVGAEVREEASKDEQRHEEPKPGLTSEASPAEASAASASADGRSPVEDAAKASLAEAPLPVVLPEVLPE